VPLVRGDDVVDEVQVVVEAVREERADGAVDEAGRQRFFIRRPAFALNEAARHLATGGKLLAVVHRQREEVGAFADLVRERGGGQHHGVAEADHNGAIGLLGETPRLDRHCLARGVFNFLGYCLHR
jgi:hypothetical protein